MTPEVATRLGTLDGDPGIRAGVRNLAERDAIHDDPPRSAGPLPDA